MGAILAGLIQGLGKHAAEQNKKNVFAQVKANEDMAQLIEEEAASAQTPQDQIELMQLAARYRALGAKKPTQDMDLHNVFTQRNLTQIQQTRQQAPQQSSPQPQGIVQRGVTGAQPIPGVEPGGLPGQSNMRVPRNGPVGVGQAASAGITPPTPPDQNPLAGGGGLVPTDLNYKLY